MSSLWVTCLFAQSGTEVFRSCMFVDHEKAAPAQSDYDYRNYQELKKYRLVLQKQIDRKTATECTFQGYFEHDKHSRLSLISPRSDFNTQTCEIILPNLRDASVTATYFPKVGKLGSNLFATEKRTNKNLDKNTK